MQLPPDVLLTRSKYLAVYPLWTMPQGPEAEDRARAWTIGLAEQLAFSHPGQGYGCKRADPGRPISKDSIAQPQADGRLFAWDQLSGAGTGSPTLVQHPDSMDITGQVFVAVPAVDHLTNGGSTPVPPTPEPSPVIPYTEQYAIEFGLACNDVYRETTAPVDPGMISVHSQRAAWDYYVGGLDWPLSFAKHINDLRAVYGLPPL